MCSKESSEVFHVSELLKRGQLSADHLPDWLLHERLVSRIHAKSYSHGPSLVNVA
jgi:hypothetical protein